MIRKLLPAALVLAAQALPLGAQGLTGPEPVTPGGAAAHAEIPVVEMLAAAHWVVQGVSAILALALFATVTILIFKAGQLGLAARRLRRSVHLIAGAETLDLAEAAVRGRADPAARMALAAMHEWRRTEPMLTQAGPAGLKERVRAELERIAAQGVAHLKGGTGILATVGSTAPFIGLFGTVWGIMSSFLAISAQKTTNLAVVAPGIAEALLVTGFGLVAAIPAVILYNVIVRRVSAWRLALGDAAVTVEALLGRDLDRRATGG